MQKRIPFLLLLILISVIVISCRPLITQSSTATDIAPTSVPVFLKPLSASWRLVDDSLIQQENSSIAIHAIYLNGQVTILFFTLSGAGFEEFVPGMPAQITDDEGYSSSLVKVLPLGMVDKLSVGIMVFEPRRMGAQKLMMQWPSTDNDALSEKIIAVFGGEASENNANRTYYSSHNGAVEQDGYRIAVSWGLTRGDQKGEALAEAALTDVPRSDYQPTSTPATLQPLAELASGVFIMQECSFIVEEIEKGQFKTINVQLLTDANAVIQSEGIVSTPVPIIVNEPTPTPLPSAYP